MKVSRKPRLVVEALAAENDSGLGRCTRICLDALPALLDTYEIHVLLRPGPYRPPPGIRVHRTRLRSWRLWVTWVFPCRLFLLRPHKVLCLGWSLPAFGPKVPYLLYLHDVAPLEQSGFRMSRHEAANRAWLSRRAPKADGYIVPSAFTRGRIGFFFGEKAHARTCIAPPSSTAHLPDLPPAAGRGPEDRPPPGPAAEEEAAADNEAREGRPGSDFFLAVGNLEPRKNFPLLLEAYALARAEDPLFPPLLLAGHFAWGITEVTERLRAGNLEGSVRLLGFVPDARLMDLFRRCRIFLAPSLYEGFGLPLFEALALNRPALYHAGTSHEEFARGFALAADCSRAETLKEAWLGLWRDDKRRERMSAHLALHFRASLTPPEAALRAAVIGLGGKTEDGAGSRPRTGCRSRLRQPD